MTWRKVEEDRRAFGDLIEDFRRDSLQRAPTLRQEEQLGRSMIMSVLHGCDIPTWGIISCQEQCNAMILSSTRFGYWFMIAFEMVGYAVGIDCSLQLRPMTHWNVHRTNRDKIGTICPASK